MPVSEHPTLTPEMAADVFQAILALKHSVENDREFSCSISDRTDDAIENIIKAAGLVLSR